MSTQVKFQKTKLGEFTIEWPLIELGKIFPNLSTGSTPSRAEPEYFEGDNLWITSGELNYGVIEDTIEKVSCDAIDATGLKIYPPGTFFIAITGLEAQGTRGSCAINGKPATTNQSCMAFTQNDIVETEFLFQFYKYFGDKIAFNYAQGTKQQSLNKRIVGSIQIPVPEYDEQKKISNILSLVDKKLENTKAQLNSTKVLKKGVMQKLFSEGIGHSEFKDSVLGRIPKPWQVSRFEDLLISENNALGYGILQPGEGVDDGVPMLRTIDFKENGRANTTILKVPEELAEKYSKTTLKGGELLLSVMGTLGRTFIVPNEWKGWNVNRALAVIRLIETVDTRFYYHYFRSPQFKKKIESEAIGSAQLRINLSDLRKYSMPLPNVEEQRRISNILAAADDKLRMLDQKLNTYQQLKVALMQQLLTGKIRVKT